MGGTSADKLHQNINGHLQLFSDELLSIRESLVLWFYPEAYLDKGRK